MTEINEVNEVEVEEKEDLKVRGAITISFHKAYERKGDAVKETAEMRMLLNRYVQGGYDVIRSAPLKPPYYMDNGAYIVYIPRVVITTSPYAKLDAEFVHFFGNIEDAKNAHEEFKKTYPPDGACTGRPLEVIMEKRKGNKAEDVWFEDFSSVQDEYNLIEG